eukprot:766523-Hanusia_phi.AAC.7
MQRTDDSEIMFLDDNPTAKKLVFQGQVANEDRGDPGSQRCQASSVEEIWALNSGNGDEYRDKQIKNLKQIIVYEQNMREIELEKKDEIICSLKAELDKKNEVLSMLCAEVERLSSSPDDTNHMQATNVLEPRLQNHVRSMIEQLKNIQDVVMGIRAEEESQGSRLDDQSSVSSGGLLHAS